ncbi:MAG TPA: hypothetical protein VF996_00565 [Candidatus Saccharimonadales bacterium]|jgi:hypothetical protein
MNEKNFRWIVELSVFPLLVIAILVWGTGIDWRLGSLTKLQLFPLLGLIAFTTMWWHFFVGFIRQIRPEFQKFDTLHRISGYWVFVALSLHPILLWTWGAGQGFASPLDTNRAYLGINYRYALLGMFGLIVFWLYDLARWLRERAWVKRYWWLIDTVDDAAFLIIWVHAFNIGGHVQEGWFRWLWIFYGLSGLFFVIYKHLKHPATHAKSPV